MFFSFGKKKRTSRSTKKKGSRKPPAALIRMCKKHGIKCTRKVGHKRVYKSVSVLKKQLRRKKNLKKKKSVRRKSVRKVRRSTRRSFRFGDAAPFTPASNYGYNQSVPQAAGVLSQSSQVVTAANNANRPPGFGVDPAALPIYGVYRPFFTENVPTSVGPSWNFMGQPDGSLYPVGGPFSGYTSFGKRRRARFGAKSKGGPMHGEKGSHVNQPTHCKSGKAEKGPNSNWICSFGKRRARFGEMEGWVNQKRNEHPWWSPWASAAENKKNEKKYLENIAASRYYSKKDGDSFFGKRRRS